VRSIAILVFLIGCGGACGAGKTGSSHEVESQSEAQVAAPDVKATAGSVSTGRFQSDSLGVEKSYYLYLPAGYDKGDARYPVVYMLHGLGGQENNWTKHMKLTEAADSMRLPAIVVMPDGDDSFYINSTTRADYDACLPGDAERESYCVRTARYEDYIVSDLVSHVDATYRTKAAASARAIGGLSMGGYGALMLAMRHKDVFSSAASHSGVAALTYQGPIPYVAGKAELAKDAIAFTDGLGRFGGLFLSLFGKDIDFWRQRDPAILAQSLGKDELSIYIDCGTEDDFQLQHGASYLHEVLEARGITHSFHLLPGSHGPAFWSDRIDDSLAFHVEHFEKSGALATSASASASAGASPTGAATSTK
jgi:S-formylglutathione hydrolase FrmB